MKGLVDAWNASRQERTQMSLGERVHTIEGRLKGRMPTRDRARHERRDHRRDMRRETREGRQQR